MRRFLLTTGALLVALVSLGGCVFDPDIETIVAEIESQIAPADLEPEVNLRIGRGLLALAKGITGLVNEPEMAEARAVLSGVDEVHVGVYKIHGWPRDMVLDMPESMREKLDGDDWQVIVQVRERDSAVWVIGRRSGSRLGGLYVVALEETELVVVKLEGDLSRSIDAAVRHAMRHESIADTIRDAAGT